MISIGDDGKTKIDESPDAEWNSEMLKKQILLASGFAALVTLSSDEAIAQAEPLLQQRTQLQQNMPPLRVAKVDNNAVLRTIDSEARLNISSSVACFAVPGSNGLALLIDAQVTQRLQDQWMMAHLPAVSVNADFRGPVSVNLMLPTDALVTAMLTDDLMVRVANADESKDSLVPVPEVPAVPGSVPAAPSDVVVMRHGRVILKNPVDYSGWRHNGFGLQDGTAAHVDPKVFSEDEDFEIAVPPPAPAPDIFDE